MKKKLFLTAAFIISLIPMVAPQFNYDFDTATGLAILCSPIAIAAIIIYLIGVWVPFKNQKIGNLLGFFGLLGIILAEIFTFLTWHQTGLNIDQSFSNARAEFYLGLVTSCLTVEIYLCAISCAESSRRATAALRAISGKGIKQSNSANATVAKNKAATIRKTKKAQKKASAKAQKAAKTGSKKSNKR